MKRTLFHGTTYENYLSIMQKGFYSQEMVWTCSDDNVIYFYDDSKDCNCILEGGTIEDLHHDLINQAFSSAQITAGIQNPKDNRLVVFEVEIDEKFIEDDWSCENMSDVASCVDIDNLELKDIKNVYISNNAYNPNLRFFYISNIYNNDYLNKWNFTELEKTAIEVIANAELFIDELLDYNWKVSKNVLEVVA